MKGFYNELEIVLISKNLEKEYFPIAYKQAFENLGIAIEEDLMFPNKATAFVIEQRYKRKKGLIKLPKNSSIEPLIVLLTEKIGKANPEILFEEIRANLLNNFEQ